MKALGRDLTAIGIESAWVRITSRVRTARFSHVAGVLPALSMPRGTAILAASGNRMKIVFSYFIEKIWLPTFCSMAWGGNRQEKPQLRYQPM